MRLVRHRKAKGVQKPKFQVCANIVVVKVLVMETDSL